MRVITADETGLVKVVRVESGECLAVNVGQQTRARAVKALCHNNLFLFNSSSGSYSSKAADYCSIHVARSAGAVETWDVSHFERDGVDGAGCSLSLRGTVDCPVSPLAITCLPPTAGSTHEPPRILTCSADGQVQLFSPPPDKNASKPTLFSIRGPISTAVAVGTGVTGGSGAAVAAGGRDNDLKIYDVLSSRCTWKAKNAPHDFLDLRQPVWISSLLPLAPDEGLRQIVAGTAHRQVRLYDTRAQKRPTHSVDADEHGITTMAVAPSGLEVVVADTAGLVRVLDLRNMHWGRRFAGPGGSVRGLAFHPTLPFLACVGLDRMMRVYNSKTAEQKHQVYLKQRLNAVLFDDEGEVRVSSSGDKDNTEHEKRNGKGGGGEGGSGSDDEGWGSGEEYEMDDGSSEEEEEEEDGEESKGISDGNVGNPEGRGRGAERRNGKNKPAVSSGAEADGSDSESDDDNDSEEEEEDEENIGRKKTPRGGEKNNAGGSHKGNATGSIARRGKGLQTVANGDNDRRVDGRGSGSSSGEEESGGIEDESNSEEEEEEEDYSDDFREGKDVEGGRGVEEGGGEGEEEEDDYQESSDEDSSESDGADEEDYGDGVVAEPRTKRRVDVGRAASVSSSARKRRR